MVWSWISWAWDDIFAGCCWHPFDELWCAPGSLACLQPIYRVQRLIMARWHLFSSLINWKILYILHNKTNLIPWLISSGHDQIIRTRFRHVWKVTASLCLCCMIVMHSCSDLRAQSPLSIKLLKKHVPRVPACTSKTRHVWWRHVNQNLAFELLWT
jgi:hypothetical protein